MLTAQPENLTAGLEELIPLFPGHYKKLALDQDEIPLAPQYDIYLERDARGEVMYIALRDNGRLIGYWVAFIAPGLHYKTCLTGTMDIWNILPEYEGGYAPLILMRAVEKEYDRRNVKRRWAGEKLHRPCGRLFKLFGYEAAEMYHSKMVK